VFDGEGEMNKQLQIMMLRGAPASGKSFFARELMRKEPGRWKRLNNDLLREGIDCGVWSQENEKHIRALRKHMLQEFLRAGYDIIVDNVNGGTRNFDEVCTVVGKMNLNCCVFEKAFYCPLNELIERDSKRDGNAKVGEKVVERWFKELGGDQFRFYKVRSEVFMKLTHALDKPWAPMEQDQNLKRAAVFDNDGTISLIPANGRSPYDASTCDKDIPHEHVIECMRLYHKAGYKILFVSGREEKDREPTERFYKQHFPEVEYELYMRPTGNQEKDVVIKERIFNEHIKGKYFVAAWFDDRISLCRWIFESGLPLFRCNDPEASF
jgi:predicted kinase